jgi:hypothetical protein
MQSVKAKQTDSPMFNTCGVLCNQRAYFRACLFFAESTVACAVRIDANVEFLTPLLEGEGPNKAPLQKCKSTSTPSYCNSEEISSMGCFHGHRKAEATLSLGHLITWPPRPSELKPLLYSSRSTYKTLFTFHHCQDDRRFCTYF